MDKQAYEHLVGLTIGKKASFMDDIREQVKAKAHEYIDSPENTAVHMEGSKFKPHKLGPLYRDKVLDLQHKLVYAEDTDSINRLGKEFTRYGSDIHNEVAAGDGLNSRTINTRMPSYGLWGSGGAAIGSAVAGEGNRLLGGFTGLILGLLANYGRRKLKYGDLVKW